MKGQNAGSALASSVADHMAKADEKIFELLGIQVVAVDTGTATLSLVVREDMVNSHAYCHGGFVYALADTAFAYAVSSYNRASVTLVGQIQYVKPAILGDCLTATAKATSMGGRTGTCDVVVLNQSDQPIARFTGTAYRMGHPVVESTGLE